MNKRKRLPKAILTTAEAMREAGAAGGDQPGQMPQFAAPNDAYIDRAEEPAGNVIEMMPKSEAGAAAKSASSNPGLSDSALAKRRLQARAIVERHANLSAVGGAIPLPILNIASVTAIVLRMVKSLCRLYEVPFERNRTRAIVIGLMGGVMPTGLATAAASTLVYFMPGYNLLGLAVSSVTASAYARGIGQLFVEHFENGSTTIDFPSIALR